MVSGFLISPYDQDRILSGLAIEIRIWSKTWAGTCGLKRFITSWFILVSVSEDRGRTTDNHRVCCQVRRLLSVISFLTDPNCLSNDSDGCCYPSSVLWLLR